MPRILVVEDEVAMQVGLRDNLEAEGYSVDVAKDGICRAQGDQRGRV